MNKCEQKLYTTNFGFLEKNFTDFINEKNEIANEWNEYFKNLDTGAAYSESSSLNVDSQGNSINYIIEKIAKFHRKFGALVSNLNPLDPVDGQKDMNEQFLAGFNLTNAELDTLHNNPANEHNYQKHFNGLTVKEIINKLGGLYLDKLALEIEHLNDSDKYNWLVEHYERQWSMTDDERKEVLNDLLEAEVFEQFIHIKFPGAKRFSLEGGEAALVFFNIFVKTLAQIGADEVCLGMAHRGRLNFLTKICGEGYASILAQFAGKNYLDDELNASGDVKYHLGSSKLCNLDDGKSVRVTLMPNPSHLESVNPVVLGNARAKQDALNAKDSSSAKFRVIPFLIHGDASFVGQGVVYECIAMSNLVGYDTGGTVHLIIDNQVGFTADAKETRPSKFASDMAKTLNIPIFHINGESVEGAVKVAKLCAEYRSKFTGDIIINIVCYRKYGHNEGDEPNFTNPVLYSKIAKHKALYNLYLEELVSSRGFEVKDWDDKVNAFHAKLSDELENFKSKGLSDIVDDKWRNFSLEFDDSKPHLPQNTSCDDNLLKKAYDLLSNIPADFNINTKLKKLLIDARLKMLSGESDFDWGCGEMLAFIKILSGGKSIRISGEDVVRGTFAHRHSALTDQATGEKYFYYASAAGHTGAKFEVYNSLLSEYGVMGFDYGYSLNNPCNLVIWEAQFGDFANGAQIMIDQYIASAEQKWLQMSGLVLMLPHGYEGQGPEHSSARIERFLQLAAQFNMRIIQPTTPANLYHALVGQVCTESNLRKPMIIFTPKSLLRHKLATSSVSDFTGDSAFKPVINNNISPSDASIKKVLLCSGRIYYEIIEALADRKDVFVLKLEQIYPLPTEQIMQLLSKITLKEIYWVQDEPRNMGAFSFIYLNLFEKFMDMGKRLKYIGREASASTAVGSLYKHNAQQKLIIEECTRV